MSSFADNWQAGAQDNMLAYFGDLYTFTKRDGTTIQATASIHDEEKEIVDNRQDGSEVVWMRSAWVKTVDNPSEPNVVAIPKADLKLLTTLEIDGLDYTVVSVMDQSRTGDVELKLQRIATREKTRPGYRSRL